MVGPFVVYQGTFDPFTNGHLDILKQALARFGAVRVLLLVNPAKKPLFSLHQRKEIIAAATVGLQGVSIDSDEGLLVDYMRKYGVTICVRGVRNQQDEAYEQHNHQLSHALYPALQTILLPCSPAYQAVSSSAVTAACRQGQLPRQWVSATTFSFLQKKFPHLQLI